MLKNENLLVFGDNLNLLEILKKRHQKVDLIYIDPPFASGRDYFATIGKEKVLAFSDKLSLENLLDFLKPRLRLMREILKDSGSIFVHVDHHTSHYIKILLDQIFGRNQFRNEIIWRRMTGTKNDPRKRFPNITDSIFFYSKTNQFKFNPQFEPLTKERLKEYRAVDEFGRRYALGGRYAQRRSYLDQSRGTPVSNLWTDIINIQGGSREHAGFQTQKPIKLIERIIKTGSSPGDVISDFFCGSGSSLIAAERTGRRWIGCDQSEIAIKISQIRLKRLILNRPFSTKKVGDFFL